MMRFILIIFLLYLSFRVFWHLFGPFLIQLVVRKSMENMQKQFINTENAFQNRYDAEHDREITVNPNLTVKVPRNPNENKAETSTGRHIDNSRISDVDFREVNE